MVSDSSRSKTRNKFAFHVGVYFQWGQVFQEDFVKGFTQWLAENHVRSLVGAGFLDDLRIFQITIEELPVCPSESLRG